MGRFGFTSFGGFGGGGSRGFTSSSSSLSTRRFSVSRPGTRRGPAGSSSAGSAGDASSSPPGDFPFSFFPAAGFFSSSPAGSHPSFAKSSVASSRNRLELILQHVRGPRAEPVSQRPAKQIGVRPGVPPDRKRARWTTGHSNVLSAGSPRRPDSISATSPPPRRARRPAPPRRRSRAPLALFAHFIARCHRLAMRLKRLLRSSATSTASVSVVAEQRPSSILRLRIT